jgi:alpha 1,3-glucosidase
MNEISAFNQVDGTAGKDWLHLNGTIEERETHSAYGLMMTSATYQGLLERDNYSLRPFVLTRSFFAGSQKYTFHWSGDNYQSWEHIRISVELALTAGLNGVPYTGSDIGGYAYDVEDQMHVRWFQAAAYIYPFYRQHASDEAPYREPYLFNETKPEIFKAMLQVTQDRYQLLALWYTAAYHNHISGSPLVAPLWYDFPEVDHLHDIRYQAILGHRLMSAPALFENQSSVNVTKPPGRWFEYKTGKEIFKSQEVNVTLADIPVYIRGGTVTPVFTAPHTSSSEQIREKISLIFALDENGKAEGDLYLDDGRTFNFSTKYIYTKFTYDNGHFVINATGSCDEVNNVISEFVFYGISKKDAEKVEVGGVHTFADNVLRVTGLSYSVKTSFESISTGKDINLWIIAISICCVMLILIVAFGIFICKLDKNSEYQQLSYTESVTNQKDEPKSVV